MKYESTKKIYVCIALFLLGEKSFAQINLSKIELGANANAFVYQGDLTPTRIGSLKTIKLGLGIFAIYKLNNSFSLKTNFDFGGLKGDESKYTGAAYRKQRNFKFKTPVTEISESLVWNIIPPTNESAPRLSPYLSAGIGYTFLHITRDYSHFNAAYFAEEGSITTGLAADSVHSLPRGQLVFPVGAGLRYSISDYLSLNLEAQYRLNSTDYLDGFSQAVNPAKKDHYFTAGVGLIYSFGKKNNLQCPKVRR